MLVLQFKNVNVDSRIKKPPEGGFFISVRKPYTMERQTVYSFTSV